MLMSIGSSPGQTVSRHSEETPMSRVICNLSITADGYSAKSVEIDSSA